MPHIKTLLGIFGLCLLLTAPAPAPRRRPPTAPAPAPRPRLSGPVRAAESN